MKLLSAILALTTVAKAATLIFDWNITWVTATPNNFTRPTIGINNQWPNPTIHATTGDRIIVHAHNALANETTSLHWHGLYMTDTPHMDGAAGVSQCPILPGQTFTYEFTVEQGGTYWWHSHVGGQYADGLRGALVVKDPGDPHRGRYDEEYLMGISDWYNDQVPTLLSQLFSPSNIQFRPPLANSALINDSPTQTYPLIPGRKYRFRLINYSALANAIVCFAGHSMTIIETDGVPVVPVDTDTLLLGAGQRYSVVVEARNETGVDYGVLVMLDMNPDYHAPTVGFNVNATATLKYGENNSMPEPVVIHSRFEVFDDTLLSPTDLIPAYEPTTTFTKNFTFALDPSGTPRAYLNDHIYVNQKVTTLYTALTTGNASLDPAVYGPVNPTIIAKDAVVQIILNNFTPASHPFHLHGHHFQVIQRGPVNAGPFNGTLSVPKAPLFRDTVMVEGNSHVVIRYLASRPGVWIFHCHMEWHVHMGATSTFITAPMELQAALTVPESHFDICACGFAKGNAAGNTENVFDLTGANEMPMLPDLGAIYNGESMAACLENATGTGAGTVTMSVPLVTPTGFFNSTTVTPTGTGGTVSPTKTKTPSRCRAQYRAVPDQQKL